LVVGMRRLWERVRVVVQVGQDHPHSIEAVRGVGNGGTGKTAITVVEHDLQIGQLRKRQVGIIIPIKVVRHNGMSRAAAVYQNFRLERAIPITLGDINASVSRAIGYAEVHGAVAVEIGKTERLG
jgi:hypothetical protein